MIFPAICTSFCGDFRFPTARHMAVEKSTRDDSPDHTLPAGEGPQGGGLSSPCMAHQTQLHRVEWLHSLAMAPCFWSCEATNTYEIMGKCLEMGKQLVAKFGNLPHFRTISNVWKCLMMVMMVMMVFNWRVNLIRSSHSQSPAGWCHGCLFHSRAECMHGSRA